MVVEDVVCAIKGVRVHLDEYRRLGSRKSPNEYAPANRTEMATRCIVIDPVLKSLGWDPSDSSLCRIEYITERVILRRNSPRPRFMGSNKRVRTVVSRRRVDYALLGSDGRPAVLVEAKRLQLSVRNLRTSDDNERREIWQKDWQSGINQLLGYLDKVDSAGAEMLTNGQEWLFVKWETGKENWKWDSKPILLSSRRNVEVIAQELHDRLAREHYLPLDSS